MQKKQQHLPGQFFHLEGCFHSQKIVIVCNKFHLLLRMFHQIVLLRKIHYHSLKFSQKHEFACTTTSAALC